MKKSANHRDGFINLIREHARAIMGNRLGANFLGGGRCQFLVWAPFAQSVEVMIFARDHQHDGGRAAAQSGASGKRANALEKIERGYYQTTVENVEPGALYLYRLDGNNQRPDPASRFQPFGVHKASEVVDLGAFRWNDSMWRGIPLEDYITYEVHVGTYTAEGTFDALIPHLDQFNELGITAVELMPVAQFPGIRNWGYDGVHPFAAQNSYGGPEGLMRLVDACHARGLAVVLDVVYNHIGPEGNYLGEFGPYFTDQYCTPWGQAINFDGPWSDEVVRFFIENALQWVRDFHIDALRLDAIHGIVDRNAQPFLELLGVSVHEFACGAGRNIYVIPESDLNDVRFIRPREQGGYGLDAQWSDDLHHALHTLLTNKHNGYYLDFGKIDHLAKALTEGYVYSGQYSEHRHRRHGNCSRNIPATQFVVCAQNHDQVGNRLLGDRLSTLVSFEALKLAAGTILLSPFLPLVFMGEEYGEPAPFQYFISHLDPELIEAVRRGRREEFAAFDWQSEIPDPQDEQTFLRCKLDHSLRQKEPHRTLLEFYRELIKLRRTLPGLAQLSKKRMEVFSFKNEKVIHVRRWSDQGEALMLSNFSDEQQSVAAKIPQGNWRKLLDSADPRWRGPGSSVPEIISANAELKVCAKSFSLFERLV